MIGKVKHVSGAAGRPLNYMMGGKYTKDQIVKVISYNGFALSGKMLREIESVPTTPEEKRDHKKNIWKIAQEVGAVYDARASMADYRVTHPMEEFFIGFSPEDRSILTPELNETVTLEFMEKMGIHGDITVTRRRKGGNVKEKVHRESIYMVCFHDGTNAPHNHLYFCRVDEHGKVNDTRDEGLRALKVCRELSRKYGLHMTLNEAAGITEEKGYTLTKEAYTPNKDKANDGYVCKIEMCETVKRCLQFATSWEELGVALLQNEISLEIKRHDETNEPYGVKFSLASPAKKEDYKFTTYSGSQLDRSLAYGRIAKQLEKNRAAALKKKETEATISELRRLYPYVDDAYKRVSAAYERNRPIWAQKQQVRAEITKKYQELSKMFEIYKEIKHQVEPSRDCLKFAALMTEAGLLGIPFVVMGILAGLFFAVIEDERPYHRRDVLRDIDCLKFDIEELKIQESMLNESLVAKSKIAELKADALRNVEKARAAIKEKEAAEKVASNVVRPAVQVKSRPFLATVAQGMPSVQGMRTKLQTTYAADLEAAKQKVVSTLKKENKASIWRSVKVTDVVIDDFYGGNVSATCHVQVNNQPQTRVRIDLSDTGKPRITSISEKYVRAYSTYVDLKKAAEQLGFEEGQVTPLSLEKCHIGTDLLAMAVATDYGKQYIIRSSPYSDGRDAVYYVSEPVTGNKTFADLVYFGKGGVKYTKANLESIASGRREQAQKAGQEVYTPSKSTAQNEILHKGRGV